MKTTVLVSMARGELLRLKEAAGQLIRLDAGRLWITHEDEGIDYVVEPGETFRVRSGGLTLVSALRQSALQVSPSAKPVAAGTLLREAASLA
jgi:hypothetical protein